MSTEKPIDYEDYFFTKYNSDISDLFLELKEISNGFCLNLLIHNLSNTKWFL